MTTIHAPTPAAAHHHPYRRWRLAAGWGAVALLAVHAIFRGGIAIDLMLAIMELARLFSGDILDLEPDWFGMLHRSAAVALGGYLALRTLRYQRRTRGACARCGRSGVPARDRRRLIRVAAWASVVPAAAYAVLKLNWGFGGTIGLNDPSVFAGVRPWSPGMGDTAVMAAIGIGLVLVMAYQRPRLPRWLLLPPALLGCLLLLPVGVVGTGMTATLVVNELDTDLYAALAPWVVFGIYPTFLLWGILLGIVTVGYHYQTRRDCRHCGGV